MAEYRILALDGGGIRGIYTAVLLEQLSQEVPGFLDRADFLAGTSTGGILALGLARGLTPAQLVALFQENGSQVFSASPWHEIRDVGDVIGAKYDISNLESLLRRTFGDDTLADLPRPVLIPSFDLDNRATPPKPRLWKPKFFHNFPGRGSDRGEKVADVALRTSAAPTYFPVYQGYVDGGVVANNPAMAALAQALDPRTGGQKFDDVRLFSVGTGVTPTYISGENLNWGVVQWAHPLVNMIIEGMMDVAHYECAQLLHGNYFRLAPILSAPVPLDAASKIPDLIADAQNVPLAPAVAWLKANFGGQGKS